MHDDATSHESNQTDRGDLTDTVETHFVALSNVGGTLYELDGRKDAPIDHGETSDGTFLKDACKVVKAYMDRDPGDLRFTIVALAPTTK